jgi:hypothetical protein
MKRPFTLTESALRDLFRARNKAKHQDHYEALTAAIKALTWAILVEHRAAR